MFKKLFFSLLIFSMAQAVFAGQWQELRYDDYVYDSDIKSVLLRNSGEEYSSFPVMNLGSMGVLSLDFDHLQSEQDFFQYTFVHCTADWKPSNLQVSEYLEGTVMGEIRKYTFSTNTFQQYVHYSVSFPANDMRLIKSGNYLLKVFRNFDQEELVITQRFVVLDTRTKTKGEVKGATAPSLRFSSQEVDFEANYENYQIPNPFTDVNAVILQNRNWQTAKYNIKPLFVNSNNLIFNYEDVNVFPGTNEFRFFDIRSLRFFSNQVLKKFNDTLVNAVLRGDELRSHLTYSFQKDFNGRRVFENKDGTQQQVDLDYAKIHFSLETGNKLKAGDVYIYGELTNWHLLPEFRMEYINSKGAYYKNVKLKQGYYNYHYVTAKDLNSTPEYIFTEGNHFQSENDYIVLIYHHNMYYDYDELIGMISLNNTDER